MNNQRHTFKQDNTKQKTDFKLSMYNTAKEETSFTDDKLQKLFNLIDYYAENPGDNSFLTLQRVLTHIFSQEEVISQYLQEDNDNLVKWINSQLSQEKQTPRSQQHLSDHDAEHLRCIVSEFKQIEQQAAEMMGKSIKIARDISIVNVDNDKQTTTIDNIDEVELIDLGDDMDSDASLITDKDLQQNHNFACIFCDNTKIIVLSSTEGYCPKCNKNFLIQKRGDNKKFVLNEH